jgi:uncharacterized membrane protein
MRAGSWHRIRFLSRRKKCFLPARQVVKGDETKSNIMDTPPPSPPPPPPPSEPATPPPPPPPAPGAPASGTTSSDTGLAPNIAAALAVFFSLIGGIAFLVLEKKDQFVRFHAMQSVIFGGINVIFWTVFSIVGLILGFIPFINIIAGIIMLIVGPILGLGFLCVWVFHVFKAFSGEEFSLPWIGKMARQQLAKMGGPQA